MTVNEARDRDSTTRVDGPKPRPRRRAPLALLGVLVPLALVAATEGVLRLLHFGEHRALLRVEMQGGAVLTRQPKFRELAADTKGSYDRIAATLEKPARTIRIVVVGESTAAGFPFFPHFSFARLLEAKLRRAAPTASIEVVNFGRAADPSDEVARTAIEAMACAPDLLVVCSGHNEFQVPYCDALRDDPAATLARWASHLRLLELVRPRAGLAPPRAPHPPEGRTIGDEPFLSASERARGESHFEENLRAIVAAARAHGVEVALMTQVANLRSFPPSYSFFEARLDAPTKSLYEWNLGELEQELAAPDPSGHAEDFAKVLEGLDPGVARLRFARARLDDKRGRRDAARAGYLRALAADGYPNRAGTLFNATIRRVAAELGVRLVDAEAAFFAAASGPAPGEDLFLDHCHPTIEGAFLLADVVAPAAFELLRRKDVPFDAAAESRPMLEQADEAGWLERLDLTRARLATYVHRAGEVNLLAWLQSPTTKEPLALARRAFEESLQLDAGQARSLAGLALLAVLDDAPDRALQYAERAHHADATALADLEKLVPTLPVLERAFARNGLTIVGGQLLRERR